MKKLFLLLIILLSNILHSQIIDGPDIDKFDKAISKTTIRIVENDKINFIKDNLSTEGSLPLYASIFSVTTNDLTINTLSLSIENNSKVICLKGNDLLTILLDDDSTITLNNLSSKIDCFNKKIISYNLKNSDIEKLRRDRIKGIRINTENIGSLDYFIKENKKDLILKSFTLLNTHLVNE